MLLLFLASAGPAGAGAVGRVIEAPTEAGLALAVSRAEFADGSAPDVVVSGTGDVALAAMAAAFTGLLPSRAPLLFTGAGAPDVELRTEIARVTGGPGRVDPPQVWLFGATVEGLSGYDVHNLGGRAEAMVAILEEGPGAGTGTGGGRVLLFAPDDEAAAAVAAGFGAVAGIPALATGDPPASVSASRAIAVGSVAVPDGRFDEVVRIEGADAAALSAKAAKELFEKEVPAGAPVTLSVRPVAADGFGAKAGPSLLAAVVAGGVRDRGALAPVLLVDGRPGADLAAGCSGGARDASALCALAQADGETTVLALSAAAPRAADVERLPATGAAPPVAAVVLLALFFVMRRRPA